MRDDSVRLGWGSRRCSRRTVVSGGLSLGGLAWLGCRSDTPAPGEATALDTEGAFGALEEALSALQGDDPAPGFSAALLRDGQLVWKGAFGLADVQAGRPRSATDLQNIGSITKTLTTTLALQQVERGTLDLDADVQEVVSFPVRNPRFPEVPITLRQLLVHRSSILDGAPYEESYGCGDRPLGDLERFLDGYFRADALDAHFHEWAPGTEEVPEQPRAYSNVAFGLVGHLVEKASGRSYEEELRVSLLEPLGMATSGVRSSDIDRSLHVVPYSVPEEMPEEPVAELLPADPGQTVEVGQPFGHCLYSFGTPPDGLLRTSAVELGRFIAAWAGLGALGDARVLEAATVESALAPEHLGRALCWSKTTSIPGEPFFLHGGGDPGIGTLAGFRPQERSGFVVLGNSDAPPLREIVDLMIPHL